MIDLVGYRVNSRKATHFRQWATDVLKEYLVKGFAMAPNARAIACWAGRTRPFASPA